MKALSPRVTFLLILAIFVLPLVLAWLMYSGVVQWGPTSTRNQGTLVQPPVHIDWAQTTRLPDMAEPSDLADHWVVLHRVPANCDPACLDRVTLLRQVHRASGRNQDRIRLALLFDRDPTDSEIATLANIYPLFILLSASTSEVRDSLAVLEGKPGAVDYYLVDPRGDIILTYNDSESAAKLSKDLKTLMTWSEQDRRR